LAQLGKYVAVIAGLPLTQELNGVLSLAGVQDATSRAATVELDHVEACVNPRRGQADIFSVRN
jgi:hypothetical protein